MVQNASAELISLDNPLKRQDALSAASFLAQTRETRRLVLLEISAATNIRVDHLAAIEAGDASQLPAIPYAIGFVRTYADYLALDAEAVSAQFKREVYDLIQDAELPKYEATYVPDQDRKPFGALIAVAVVLSFAIWAGVQMVGQSENADRISAGDGEGVRITFSSLRAAEPMPNTRFSERLAPSTDGEANEPVIAAETPEEKVVVSIPEQLESAVSASAIAREAVTEELVGPNLDAITDTVPTPVSAPSPAPAPVEIPQTESLANATIIEPLIVKHVKPNYPPACAANGGGIESVVVTFDITAQGATQNPQVASSSNACLNGAALTAVSQWRYRPKTVDGTPALTTGQRAHVNFIR